MVEAEIVKRYQSSKKNCHDRFLAVNSLRHLLMDSVSIDVKDDAAYLQVYESAMSKISGLYPFLSGEVERQVRKKKRRVTRRGREERKDELHL